MKLYISGPITGWAHGNRHGFAVAGIDLRAAGYETVNPHDIGDALEKRLGREPTWEEYMRADLIAMLQCDGVALLDGWIKSNGAKYEYDIAYRLRMPAKLVEEWLEERE